MVIINIFLIIIGFLLMLIGMQNIGWDRREKMFQDNPSLFMENGQPAIKIWRDSSGDIIIKDFRKRLQKD